MAGPKRPPQDHRDVQEWGVQEETKTGGGRGQGQRRDGLEVYGEQLHTVSWFKYLGRILTERGDNWPAVAGNLVKARESWGRLQGIISREGATKRVSVNF